MEGSYKIQDFTTNIEAEIHRLKGQVDLFFDKELKKYLEFGLKNGQRIIECGSGPGYLLTRILEHLPDCRATALEIDPYLLDILKTQSSAGEKQLFDVVAGSITNTGLPDNIFDTAIVRLVMEHIPDPEKALSELYRILKPGGKLIIVSNDFSLHLITYPSIPELDLLYKAYCASQESKGGNPLIGRQLPFLLQNTGFVKTGFDVIFVHNILDNDKAFFKAEDVHISARLVKEGFLEKKVFDTLAVKWYEMLKTAGHTLYRQLFIACGEKSGLPVLPAGVSAAAPELRNEKEAFLQRIMETSAGVKEEPIEDYIIAAAAEILEQEPGAIRNDLVFHDLGMDSISGVEFIYILLSDFGYEVAVSELLTDLTIKTLAHEIFLVLDSRDSH